MKTYNVVQGSDEWLALRAEHKTASEASIMMGASKKCSRSDLVRMEATGDVRDVSDWVKNVLFENGHAIEEAARPLAELFIGEDLYPVTGADEDDYLLASFDGLTLLENIAWECKSWNEAKATDVRAGKVPDEDRWQVVQQLVVSGAEMCLYTVSDGTPDNTVHVWYSLQPGDREQLLAGWKQFETDVANYQHIEDTPAPAGKAPETLPALRIELTGMVTASNLDEFKATALAVIDSVSTDLQTDQDFANADKAVKWCGDVETRIDAAKQHALSQTADIDALFRALDEIKAETRAKRLTIEKLMKSRKESVRVEIQQAAVADLRAHYDQINETLYPCALTFPADFSMTVANAMKGKKTVASLRDAASTAAAHAKIAASQAADRTRINLQAMNDDYRHLFPDLNALATAKAPDDFKAVIALRIAEHKAKINRDAEEAREKIRKEEEDKAQREAEHKAEQERKRIRAEEQAKAEAAYKERKAAQIQERSEQQHEADKVSDASQAAFIESQRWNTTEATHAAARPQAPAASTSPIKPTRPTDAEIIDVLVMHYRVHESKVIEWLLDMDLHAEGEKLAAGMI